MVDNEKIVYVLPEYERYSSPLFESVKNGDYVGRRVFGGSNRGYDALDRIAIRGLATGEISVGDFADMYSHFSGVILLRCVSEDIKNKAIVIPEVTSRRAHQLSRRVAVAKVIRVNRWLK